MINWPSQERLSDASDCVRCTDAGSEPSTCDGVEPLDERSLAELHDGLSAWPRTISSKYFYDRRGSQLFDQICETEEYYPTRVEESIMAGSIGEIAIRIGAARRLIEYGSGSSRKTRWLLKHLSPDTAYVPVDISGRYLDGVAERLRDEFPGRAIDPVVADFTRPFSLPDVGKPGLADVVYFPGSTIGNFAPEKASELLRGISQQVGVGGGLLIGFDTQKPIPVLEAAYNDGQGVTAEFNLNLLRHLNRVASGNFDLAGFQHVAIYCQTHHRIEMHLESRWQQSVRLDGRDYQFDSGERILTEYSHKYSVAGFESMLSACGWKREAVWTDKDQYFAVAMFRC